MGFNQLSTIPGAAGRKGPILEGSTSLGAACPRRPCNHGGTLNINTFILIKLSFEHFILGTDFKNKKTTKQELHRFEGSKVLFLPSYWPKKNCFNNILGEILVSLFSCFLVPFPALLELYFNFHSAIYVYMLLAKG